MTNDEANNYYFVLKNLSEFNSSGWLRDKKEAIINNNNIDFQNALDDALNYQIIETHPERISNLILVIIIENREIFQQDQKNGKNSSEIMIQSHLIYYV